MIDCPACRRLNSSVRLCRACFDALGVQLIIPRSIHASQSHTPAAGAAAAQAERTARLVQSGPPGWACARHRVITGTPL